jgi:hypothetical protein
MSVQIEHPGCLQDFINHTAVLSDRRISTAEAVQLIDAADEIMGVLGCPRCSWEAVRRSRPCRRTAGGIRAGAGVKGH